MVISARKMTFLTKNHAEDRLGFTTAVRERLYKIAEVVITAVAGSLS